MLVYLGRRSIWRRPKQFVPFQAATKKGAEVKAYLQLVGMRAWPGNPEASVELVTVNVNEAALDLNDPLVRRVGGKPVEQDRGQDAACHANAPTVPRSSR